MLANLFERQMEDVRPGVRRSGYATDQVMLVMNVLRRGMALNPHVHEDFDQLAYVTLGEADYYIEDTPHRMTAGSVLLVPAGRYHHIEPVSDVVHNLDIFVPPRSDLMHLVMV